MAAYLSAAWLEDPIDPAAEALAAAGDALRIGRIVTGAPDGEARFTAVVAGGAVTYAPGTAEDVEVTLTDTYPNAVAMLEGELDPNASFMRGRTKVTGATGQLLRLLAATKTDAYHEARRRALEGIDR